MPINLLLLATTVGMGLIGGATTSLTSTLIGKASLKRLAVIEKDNVKKLVDECHAKNKTKLKQKILERNKKCFSCKALIPKKAVFCTDCGKPVAGNMICENCGISLPDNATFCYICGITATNKEIPSEDTKPERKKKRGRKKNED